LEGQVHPDFHEVSFASFVDRFRISNFEFRISGHPESDGSDSDRHRMQLQRQSSVTVISGRGSDQRLITSGRVTARSSHAPDRIPRPLPPHVNETEMTIPPLKLLTAADCCRGSPTPNAAAVRCLLRLPLDAVAVSALRETERFGHGNGAGIVPISPNSG
jgi:hypothetical protein